QQPLLGRPHEPGDRFDLLPDAAVRRTGGIPALCRLRTGALRRAVTALRNPDTARAEGISIRTLAAAIGLSPSRVHQVVAAADLDAMTAALGELRAAGWPAP